MITISQRVRELLEGLDAAVFYFYPQSWTRLPAVAWRQSGNRVIAQADGLPHLAELTYAVDLWGRSPEENEALSRLLDGRMLAAGLRREYLSDLFDARTGFHHRSLRYRCVADGDGNIYQ